MSKQKSDELEQLCKKLASIHKSTVLAIILPDEPLLPSHLLQVQKSISGKKCKKLDIVIHSGGGDINTAYQIVELLRRCCDNMTTVIPLYAKSAASLFILGSNEVVMGELAQSGPLDTQIPEREKGGRKYTSALNPFKTLEELQRFALETLDVTVKLLLARADLSVDDAIKRAMDFASKISAPLLAQLNAEKVGEYSRALEIGKEYGERLLRRFTKWQDKTKRDIILEKIIRGYPSHDYIIDYEELNELGFDVRLPSDSEKPVFDEIIEYILATQKTEILAVSEEEGTSSIEKAKSRKKRG